MKKKVSQLPLLQRMSSPRRIPRLCWLSCVTVRMRMGSSHTSPLWTGSRERHKLVTGNEVMTEEGTLG